MESIIISILKEINPYVEVSRSTQLLEEGVIDSLSILLLYSMLEEKFSIKIPEAEFKPEYFKNISSIINLINKVKEMQE